MTLCIKSRIKFSERKIIKWKPCSVIGVKEWKSLPPREFLWLCALSPSLIFSDNINLLPQLVLRFVFISNWIIHQLLEPRHGNAAIYATVFPFINPTPKFSHFPVHTLYLFPQIDWFKGCQCHSKTLYHLS